MAHKEEIKEASMNKEEVDQLYHLLRVASSITGGAAIAIEGKSIDSKTGLTPHEEVSVLYGLCRHLLAGGDYSALVQFSQYYGLKFLLDPTYKAIREKDWGPKRIVEFGAGLGWLGRGLASKLGFLPVLFVDKRPWVLVDVVADLETEEGRVKVLAELRTGDLIVMADLLHCVGDPRRIMEHFSRWPTAVLEYCPVDADYAGSYSAQIGRYGASPLMPEVFEVMFPGREVDIMELDPYILLLVGKEVTPMQGWHSGKTGDLLR